MVADSPRSSRNLSQGRAQNLNRIVSRAEARGVPPERRISSVVSSAVAFLPSERPEEEKTKKNICSLKESRPSPSKRTVISLKFKLVSAFYTFKDLIVQTVRIYR